MIEITHALWKRHAIGIALNKLTPGLNKFKVTIKRVDGTIPYPETYVINREEAISKYGIEEINKKGMRGVFVPLDDLQPAGSL